MTDIPTNNGIIYCRVSSLEQVDGTSLESQERLCKEYAKREGVNVLAVFIERGESAKTADRTEFTKAIAFCAEKKNKISQFIVYKIDRFSRNQTDYAIVKQKLKGYGTEIRSVSEKIDDSPSGKLMEVMLSGFAEFDNNVRTERSVNGMKERIKKGIWVWQAPLGYKRLEKAGNLVIDPAFSSYIITAFEEYAKGCHTFESIADLLNKQGFVSRHGGKAIPQLIEKILRNPLYCGIMRVWDEEYVGAFDPIISKDLFYQCQGKPGVRGKIRLKKNNAFPLRNQVLCKVCNQPLTGSKSTGRRGVKYAYYHHHKQDCDYSKFIPKENFEQSFVEYLQTITPTIQFEKAFKEIVLDIWKNNYKKFDEQNGRIRKEIDELEQRRQRVFEMHQSGIYSNSEFADQKDFLNKKISQKKLLIHDKANEEFNMEEALDYCFGFILNTAETWKSRRDDYEKQLRFQKLIFEEKPVFSGENFGTTKLTCIYEMYEGFRINPSQLVNQLYPEWNTLESTVLKWNNVFSQFGLSDLVFKNA